MRNPGLTKTYSAEAAIPAYRLVKFGAADGGSVLATGATAAIIGVSSRATPALVAGARVDTVRGGIEEVEYGATIVRGAAITSDANGKATTAAAGDYVIGYAEVSGVAGDIGSVHIVPHKA